MNEKRSAETSPRPAAWRREAVPEEVYREVERALASAESPVGIDAKHTHVLILHALERIEERLGDGGDRKKKSPEVEREMEVRTQVKSLLERSSAWADLDPKSRERLAEGMVRATRMAADDLMEAVDFPAFVASLLEGVFEAIVTASIEQMEAYADLLEQATSSADDFAGQAAGPHLARQRKRMLATMALLGTKRIRVGRRGTRARSVIGGKDDD